MWIVKGLGLILAASILFCVPLIVKKHLALTTAAQYDGVVIGHKPYSANDGLTYALEIEYQGADFRTHTFENRPASNPPARKIGDRVRVFDLGDEKPPQVLAFQTMYCGYWIWFCFSFCALGCFVAPTLMRLIYIKN
ncbi:MAG: hypothetical protein HC799_19875 [Limnothrix sp. RL_2_0]|nr:hypothetical protein [Limnothrix sp. RL_2_0]